MPDEYRSLIENGDEFIDYISDEGLKNAINTAKDWYDKAQDAKAKADDLRKSLNDLSQTRFDNVSAQFDELLQGFEHSYNILEAERERDSTSTASSIYAQETDIYLQKLDILKQKQSSLSSEFANIGEVGSQSWYDALSKVQEVDEAVSKLQTDLSKLEKTKFDNLASQFDNIGKEITHKINLTDKYISMYNDAGSIVPEELYMSNLSEYSNQYKNQLDTYKALTKQMQESVNSGLLTEGSEAWQSMRDEINSVNESLIDTVRYFIIYNNRQLNSFPRITYHLSYY